MICPFLISHDSIVSCSFAKSLCFLAQTVGNILALDRRRELARLLALLIMPLGLHALPLELLRATIAYLDLDEFCNLLRACETLRVILGAESTSKDVVRVRRHLR